MFSHLTRPQRHRPDDRRHAFTKYLAQLSAAALLIFTGCRSDQTPYRFQGHAMTIPYCLQIGECRSEAEVEKLIVETFSEIHQIYDNWNPNSEVSHLNRLPAFQTAEISPQLATFLKRLDPLVELTEGRFDPSLGTGWNKIHVEDGFFWKESGETKLDLCGVAKGYAVDLLIEHLQQKGYSNIYVEWGGEIRACGVHPAGRPWRVMIHGGPTIHLTNEAIATSGNYLQQWRAEGVTYTHLIDPRTQEHLQVNDETISSASVQMGSCMEADAIATALMLFSTQVEAQFWAEKQELEVTLR